MSPRSLTVLIVSGLAASATLANGPSFAADDGVDISDRGIVFTAADGNIELNFGGRLHVDSAFFDDDVTVFDDDTRVRRARVELSGRLFEDLRFSVSREVEGTSTGWKNAWVGYYGIDNFMVRGGNVIAPFSMEDMSSSNATSFIERALPNALAPGYYLGGMARANGDHWSFAAGYFTDPISSDSDKKSANGDGFTARATFAPISERRRVLHFGAAIERRSLDSGSPFRIRSRPEVGITSSRLIDTRTLLGVDKFTNVGLEAGWIGGPVAVVGEYITMKASRAAGPSLNFDGWYTQASWVVTGERQRYSSSSGTFGDVRPRGDFGAVELAVRYSTLDLSDEEVLGGVEKNVTLGANWYILRNFRVMANYVRAKASPNRDGINETLNTILLRFQADI